MLFNRVVEALTTAGATRSRKIKVRALADCLRVAEPAEVAVVADYLAGMTDRYCIANYTAIYVPEGYGVPAADKELSDRADMVRRLATLTPQQLRVLQMLRQGMLNKQIAYELQVGETTVKAHVSEILRKLNVYSRTQAVIEVSKLDNADLFR